MRRAVATAPHLCLAGCLLLTGCLGARVERETVFDRGDLTVVLRSENSRGKPIDRGFDHPATVSAPRAAHILASIDVRLPDESKKSRQPAIPAELIYPLGDALSQAFARANSSQEVVVEAIRRERSLKLFTEKRLTSFVAYIEDDLLYVHLAYVDWPMPGNPKTRVHEPRIGKEVMEFRALPGTHVVQVGAQGVAVEWRHPDFRTNAAIQVAPGGRVRRRTILLEEPAEDAPDPSGLPDLGELSPETLRRLADLEEERRNGGLTEAEYRARRHEILEGSTD